MQFCPFFAPARDLFFARLPGKNSRRFCILMLLMPLLLRAANAPTGLLCNLLEHPEETVITTVAPDFGWIYNPSFRNDEQTSCRIIVAASQTLAAADVLTAALQSVIAPVWLAAATNDLLTTSQTVLMSNPQPLAKIEF